jgi:TrmH family RNA methyltransferase
VVDAVRLRRAAYRREAGKTLVEGPHLVADLVRFGVPIDIIFSHPHDGEAAGLAEKADAELVLVEESILRRIADTENPRGPVAVIAIPPSVRATGSVVVLWDLADPGNAGTIVRSAAAFGFAVIVAGTSVDIWAPKTIRAGGGGHFATVIEVTPHLTVDDLKGRGFTTVATVGVGGDGPESIPSDPVAILVGNEAHGLGDEIVGQADHRFTIPMPGGTESLNAAAAASIALYAIENRSSKGGR